MDEGAPKRAIFLKRPLIYIICGIFLIAAGVAIFEIFFVTRDPIPKNIRSQANFTLFYPGSLPSGWNIDNSSYYADTSAQVVGYRLKGPNGYLGVTIQPVPSSFNFNDFYTKRLANTSQFLTTLGQGAIGKSGNTYIGSLDTPSSWVLTTSNSSGVSKTDIQYILSHMKAASSP